MFKLHLIIVVCILIPLSCYGTQLKNHIVADPNGTYHIFWEADDKNITFQLEVKTKGYMGFGFSPNGGMTDSDVIAGWVLPNGTCVFQDRHALGFYEPLIDDDQNYQLLNCFENETHTVLRFTRKLNTCDKENDTIITDDTIKIIYSWHSEDPQGTKLRYHGRDRRGTQTSFLLSPQPPPVEVTDDITTWDMQMPNITIPAQHTTYWCIFFKIPEFDGPRDYTGYTVHVKPGNEAFVHHFIVRQCRGNPGRYEQLMATYPQGFQCVVEDTLPSNPECNPPLVLWAVGSNGQTLPEGVGTTVGDEYLALQMHYTNPAMETGIVDDSFIRYYLKNKVQPIQATMLQLYNYHDYTLVVPPHQNNFPVTIYCPSECTASAIPPEGITVFSVGLHTHLIGKKLVLRHFRGNQELKPISNDDHYDFNYQTMRQLREPVIILPGDLLMGVCDYSSAERNQTTTGGISTQQEMCYFYMSYYPAVPLTFCSGSPDYQQIYDFFGVETVGPDRVHVTSPDSLYNQSVFEIVRQYDWTSGGEDKLSQMASIQYEGTKTVLCQHQGRKEMDKTIDVSYPTNARFYIQPDTCDAKETSTTSTNELGVDLESNPTSSTDEETNGCEPNAAQNTYG